jgi:glycosyltransferase involved in cell wall biosynthesis
LKSLIFRGIPQIIEKQKDADQRVRVAGFNVAESDMIGSLLTHGTYERYFFLCEAPDMVVEARKRLALYPRRERAEIIFYEDLPRLRGVEQMILFTSGENLHEAAHLRKLGGRAKWPAVGVTHSLSYRSALLPNLLTALLESENAFDCMICTSHAGRRALSNIFAGLSEFFSRRFRVPVTYRNRLEVIPLGTDAEHYRPRDRGEARRRFQLPEDHTVFLYLGRITPLDKMDPFPLLLTFARGLAAREEKVTLVLAGDDARMGLAPRLQAFVNGLGAAQKVRIMPDVRSEDKPWLYAAADVFLSPVDSPQETFGLTLIEAMASGLPVIASDWSGYGESVVHDETGFLVPTRWAECVDGVSRFSSMRGDLETHWLLGQTVAVDTAALDRYMDALHRNPALRRRMGEAGRQRILSRYTWPAVIRRYEELWDELHAEAARTPEQPAGEFEHGVSSYDYLKVFGHYATSVLDGVTPVRLTTLGRQFNEGRLTIDPLHVRVSGFDPALCRSIAAACAGTPGVAAEALAARAARATGAKAEVALMHVMRLLKYGVLELAGEAAQGQRL